jgi:hypothetical protein
LLSRSELRACILREEELGSRQDSIRQANDAQDASSAKLSAEAMELSRILRTLDNSDSTAVELYNRRNESRNAAVELHNKRSAALNAAASELQAAEADFIATCTSRSYLEADESAVLKELGLKQRRYDRERRNDQTPPPASSSI